MTMPEREQLLRDVETVEAYFRVTDVKSLQFVEAAKLLAAFARVQLAETADAGDDGELILDWPDPWLRRSGFEVSEDDERDLLFINTPVIGGFDILATSSGSWELSDGDNTLEIPRPKTRGDVRRLCKALGVELKGE